jgi:hypothetical protein
MAMKPEMLLNGSRPARMTWSGYDGCSSLLPVITLNEACVNESPCEPFRPSMMKP